MNADIGLWENITKENVEAEIEKHKLIEADYESDDDRRDKVKLTGNGLDFKALKAGKDIEFDVNQDEDDYNFDDEDDRIDYETIYKHRNLDMLMTEQDNTREDNENEDTIENQGKKQIFKTPFEILSLKMDDVTPNKDKGVLKRTLETGHGKIVPIGSRVRVHYNAYFELNDEPFDSTFLRNRSFEFKLGANEVVAGLDIAVSTMKKKEKAQFIFDCEYYCGKQGCEPRVPRDTPVLFEIEVISFVEANAYDNYEVSSDEQKQKLTLEQILLICHCLKELGNDSFARKNYRESSKKYRKAIYLLDNVSVNEDEQKKWESSMLKLYLNMSQVCLNQNKPKKTIFYCKLALGIDQANVKALFRYGSSLRLLQDFTRSRKFLLKAYNLQPSNKSISEEIEKLDDMIERQKNVETEMCKRMFNFANVTDKNKSTKGIDSNNNETKTMEEKSSLEKSKDLIIKKLKEFTEDINATVYNFQIDMYSLQTVNFILDKAKFYNLETREIKGTINILQIMKK